MSTESTPMSGQVCQRLTRIVAKVPNQTHLGLDNEWTPIGAEASRLFVIEAYHVRPDKGNQLSAAGR
jgi:hypothetical protein